MTRKIRSRQELLPIRVEVEIVGLYEELSPPWRLGSADPTPSVDWDRAIFGDRKRHLRRNRTSAETPSEACCIIGRRPQATVQRGASAAASSLPAARVGVVDAAGDIDVSWSTTAEPCVGAAARSASTYSSGCARPIAISCSRGAVSRASIWNEFVFERALDGAPVIGPFGMALRSFAGEASRKGNGRRRYQVHLPIGGCPDVLPSLHNKFGPGQARQPPARASEGSASASRRGF